jgi:DNA uptake protein ComE-like DNA-binding protein
MLAAWIVLDTPGHPGSSAEGVGAGLALLTWIGGGIHAIAVSNDAGRRIQSRADPTLEAAKTRIERRARGRRLLATQPALAKEVGVGRPDVPGADDYGLIDVNHCPAATLARLPGMTLALARRTVRERVPAGGFSSVEDLGMLLDLPPGTVDQMRDTAIFVPD